MCSFYQVLIHFLAPFINGKVRKFHQTSGEILEFKTWRTDVPPLVHK